MAVGRPRAVDYRNYRMYKDTKKAFSKSLGRLSVEYENAEICRAVKLAEVDRYTFWRLVQKGRGSSGIRCISIRNDQDVVVCETEDVLGVWKTHFENLGTPREDPNYDRGHYDQVMRQTKLYTCGEDVDEFLQDAFTWDEIRSCLKSLNKGKVSGIDSISTEHLCYAGNAIVSFLCLVYDMVREV